MAVLGLRFCARAFSSCGKWGPLFIAVRGPLTIAASLVADHRLQTRRLSNCVSRAQSLRSMWDLPRPGLEPVFPASAGGFSTTAPPGKPHDVLLTCKYTPHLGWCPTSSFCLDPSSLGYPRDPLIPLSTTFSTRPTQATLSAVAPSIFPCTPQPPPLSPAPTLFLLLLALLIS